MKNVGRFTIVCGSGIVFHLQTRWYDGDSAKRSTANAMKEGVCVELLFLWSHYHYGKTCVFFGCVFFCIVRTKYAYRNIHFYYVYLSHPMMSLCVIQLNNDNVDGHFILLKYKKKKRSTFYFWSRRINEFFFLHLVFVLSSSSFCIFIEIPPYYFALALFSI